jgi:purine nucleoside permease
MSRLVACFCWAFLAHGVYAAPSTASPAKPIRVKVVVVAMFERGQDRGGTPGGYQLWVEREHLDQIFDFPTGYHHLRMNQDGVLGMLTGVGTAKAASVMALGLDPRFDLSKAYWLIRGNRWRRPC